MRKNKIIVFIALLIVMISCKTQEDIRREKTMENINEKIAQTQQYSANSNNRFQTLEEQVTKLTGSIEELSHNKGNDQKENLLLKDRVVQLEELSKKQSENIRLLADKVNEQTKYIEQVVKSLSELSEAKETHKESSKKKSEKDNKESKVDAPNIKTAIELFNDHKNEEAKSLFEDLLENTKLKKKDKAAAFYHLGMIEYKAKKYEDAKIYFSRLFTEIPDSSYSAGALLNLAKTFSQLKSKEEAKQTIDELINRFPKAKEIAEAQKLKAKL